MGRVGFAIRRIGALMLALALMCLGNVPASAAPNDGYRLGAADGGVFTFNASFEGSAGNTRLNQPIVGIETTSTGNGYWLVAADGGVFAFGDAQFKGSAANLRLTCQDCPSQPQQPKFVGMASVPTNDGYWLVSSAGGVFPYGTAQPHGSLDGVRLNQPIVGMRETTTGNGYWLVAADGGVFAFGDAQFQGSAGNLALRAPVVGLG